MLLKKYNSSDIIIMTKLRKVKVLTIEKPLFFKENRCLVHVLFDSFFGLILYRFDVQSFFVNKLTSHLPFLLYIVIIDESFEQYKSGL